MNKLIRDIPQSSADLHLRESGENSQSRTVEGHAVVFGVRSVNLTPWSSMREVYEIMEPGCIDQQLIDHSDVVLTAFHNNQLILGRSTNGKGTLALSLDAQGLAIACDLPETGTADDMIALIRRGDIRGMSFAFTTDEDDSENCVAYENTGERSADGKEIWLRHVKKVKGLYDVTIAGHPAYQQTDIAARDIDKAIDSLAKRSENADDNAAADAAAAAAAEERSRQERLRTIAALQAELDLLKGY